MELQVALAQVAPRLGEVDANFEMATAQLRAAQRQGALLTLFPGWRSPGTCSTASSRRWRWPHPIRAWRP